MKILRVLLGITFTFLIVSAGYTASTDDQDATESQSTMNKSDHMPGMMGGMHDKGMMQQGAMAHHMMHSGTSPITFVVYPGMMPMMNHDMKHGMTHGMKHGNAEGGHTGGGMQQQDMMQRQNMMKNHMELMDQRLANIEALLGELVELQKTTQ